MSSYMNSKLRNTLRGASKLIQAGRLMELTTAIQRSLTSDIASGIDNGMAEAAKATARMKVAQQAAPVDVIDVEARVVADEAAAATAAGPAASVHASPESRSRTDTDPDARTRPSRESRFFEGRFSNAAGTREYKLFVPSGAGSKPLPLLVMLHGCTQNPDDFAAGTNANELAEEQHAYVLYPAQAKVANMQKCWNWFQPADQVRDQGEPSLIAEMTREVMSQHAIDPKRVYVAGLSAGGAMAVTMATTYPDLYAAAGVHSGLPHGAAHDVMSAFSAMRQGSGSSASVATVFVPTIVFHGDSDSTVHPCNGEHVIEQSRILAPVKVASGQAAPVSPPKVERGQVPGGHSFTRSVYPDADGATLVEHWVVHGAGHAWSGGSSAGTYTDPLGPDATREMLRFFLDHPQRARH